MNIVYPLLRPLAPLLLLGATIAPAHATLLVYEGFNGYTAGTRLDQYAPNANTTGLNRDVAYYDGASPSRSANYTIATSGLTFGALQTSGNALQFVTGTNVIGAPLALTSSFTGTLWSSYLVNLSTKGTASGDGAVIRFGATPQESSSTRFNSWADSRNLTSGALAVGYQNTGTDAAVHASATGVSLATNTTYIVVNRFTNVGGSGSATATSWALTADQFASFLMAGGDEAALARPASVTAMATMSSTALSFSNSLSMALVTVGDAGTYDEIRFGSTLADVTPSLIPEPASAASLAGLAALATFGARRRRR